MTAGYSAVGWLGSLTRTLSGTSTTLLGAISYTGSGGATGQMTSAQIGNATYSYSASFDTLARPTDVKTSRISDGATLFEEAPTYDAVGDITSETTTLPTGTDVQQFCYDDFSRLTWAGSTGTPPCTGTAITPGTLTGAAYTQSFSYDNQDRLRSSPLGSYSYDDANHLHAATFVSSGSDNYSAIYDASGNMLTRAPSESQPQQKLSWDNEGRLIAWQNAPSSPTSTAQYLYDGEGNRVEQQTVNSGTTTTTVYVGPLESVSTTGGTTTTTTYYYAAGQRIALAVNGTLSYLASDLLGSATVALDGSGLPIASQLYAPYGSTRYSSGTMPTDYGFTGQRADSATGLDYYGARYYDPTLGQFTSADTVMDGQNRYGYAGGNPETYNDPTGHRVCLGDVPSSCVPNPPPYPIPLEPVHKTKCTSHCESGSGNGSTSGGTNNGANRTATFGSDNGGRGLVYLAATNFNLAVAGGAFSWLRAVSLAAVKEANTASVLVSGYTRANGTVVASYMRRPPGSVARAAEAIRDARLAKFLGYGTLLLGGAIDGYLKYTDYYNAENPDDPERQEKAIVAGVMHGVISTGITWLLVAGATAVPICGQSGVCQVVAGVLGGMAGNFVANLVVTPTTVNAVTTEVNNIASTASSVGSQIGDAASALGGFLSGL